MSANDQDDELPPTVGADADETEIVPGLTQAAPELAWSADRYATVLDYPTMPWWGKLRQRVTDFFHPYLDDAPMDDDGAPAMDDDDDGEPIAVTDPSWGACFASAAPILFVAAAVALVIILSAAWQVWINTALACSFDVAAPTNEPRRDDPACSASICQQRAAVGQHPYRPPGARRAADGDSDRATAIPADRDRASRPHARAAARGRGPDLPGRRLRYPRLACRQLGRRRSGRPQHLRRLRPRHDPRPDHRRSTTQRPHLHTVANLRHGQRRPGHLLPAVRRMKSFEPEGFLPVAYASRRAHRDREPVRRPRHASVVHDPALHRSLGHGDPPCLRGCGEIRRCAQSRRHGIELGA